MTPSARWGRGSPPSSSRTTARAIWTRCLRRSTRCRASSRGSRGAFRCCWTAASGAARTSSRRWRWEPRRSSSDDRTSTVWRWPATPGWNGSWPSCATSSRWPWGCSAGRRSRASTRPSSGTYRPGPWDNRGTACRSQRRRLQLLLEDLVGRERPHRLAQEGDVLLLFVESLLELVLGVEVARSLGELDEQVPSCGVDVLRREQRVEQVRELGILHHDSLDPRHFARRQLGQLRPPLGVAAQLPDGVLQPRLVSLLLIADRSHMREHLGQDALLALMCPALDLIRSQLVADVVVHAAGGVLAVAADSVRAEVAAARAPGLSAGRPLHPIKDLVVQLHACTLEAQALGEHVDDLLLVLLCELFHVTSWLEPSRWSAEGRAETPPLWAESDVRGSTQAVAIPLTGLNPTPPACDNPPSATRLRAGERRRTPTHMRTRHEIGRRRTFAIIAHPDAGKTTMTEKLLLYGGVIQLAGAVKAKRGRASAVSDWMEMERERGISITTSVLQFPYRGFQMNLLDTPGHADFSEDTYRTLHAVDGAVMLLDSAKGVEVQTRKLFRVCRQRAIPIFTFVNKMDRPGRDPFELVGEVESVLGIGVYPITWPIFRGGVFRGVWHRLARRVYLFDADHAGSSAGVGAERPPVEVTGLDDPTLRETFCELMPPPRARASDQGPISPMQDEFSGFVFKIQANMDKAHRDRVAFVRICSGKMSRGMKAHHVRTGREVRLANPTQFLARERNVVEDGFAGDVVGIHDPGTFQIGDTLTGGSRFAFEGIPSFAPEHFARLVLVDPMKRKQFATGLEQLAQEGTVQLYRPRVARATSSSVPSGSCSSRS